MEGGDGLPPAYKLNRLPASLVQPEDYSKIHDLLFEVKVRVWLNFGSVNVADVLGIRLELAVLD